MLGLKLNHVSKRGYRCLTTYCRHYDCNNHLWYFLFSLLYYFHKFKIIKSIYIYTYIPLIFKYTSASDLFVMIHLKLWINEWIKQNTKNNLNHISCTKSHRNLSKTDIYIGERTTQTVVDEGCFYFFMMTSSNGNIFRITGHLCGEFTGHRGIPCTKPVMRNFDVFFDLRLNKRLSIQSRGWWFETPSRPLWRHNNGCCG